MNTTTATEIVTHDHLADCDYCFSNEDAVEHVTDLLEVDGLDYLPNYIKGDDAELDEAYEVFANNL